MLNANPNLHPPIPTAEKGKLPSLLGDYPAVTTTAIQGGGALGWAGKKILPSNLHVFGYFRPELFSETTPPPGQGI